MKIYTKKGDKGKTYLINGRKVLKSDSRLEAYGTIDELNSFLGIILAQNLKPEIKEELIKIQNDLFKIGSALANPKSSLVSGLEKRIIFFEKTIDNLSNKMPEIKNFILPNGGLIGSYFHFARTICRRTERRVVEFSQKEKIDKNILIFLNRFSDLLFVMVRYTNYLEKKKETIWSSSVKTTEDENKKIG